MLLVKEVLLRKHTRHAPVRIIQERLEVFVHFIFWQRQKYRLLPRATVIVARLLRRFSVALAWDTAASKARHEGSFGPVNG